MLDGNNVNDIKEIWRYGKGKGYLLAKRYKLPVYSNFFIIENEEEAQTLLDTYKNQRDFCMRSDTAIGNIPIGIGGANGNRETMFEYIRRIKQKSNELGTKGVAIIYWDNGRFCPTHEIDGSFYLDYRSEEKLMIDYIGKGWDGSYLSHGSACHETYVIPWEDILFLDDNNRMKYRIKVIKPSTYSELRIARVDELVRRRISREEVEKSIPHKYNGIKNDYFRRVVNQVIIPMYYNKDLQRQYKEYIPIVQIENGKVLVPEIILPERLKYKKGVESEER